MLHALRRQQRETWGNGNFLSSTNSPPCPNHPPPSPSSYQLPDRFGHRLNSQHAIPHRQWHDDRAVECFCTDTRILVLSGIRSVIVGIHCWRNGSDGWEVLDGVYKNPGEICGVVNGLSLYEIVVGPPKSAPSTVFGRMTSGISSNQLAFLSLQTSSSYTMTLLSTSAQAGSSSTMALPPTSMVLSSSSTMTTFPSSSLVMSSFLASSKMGSSSANLFVTSRRPFWSSSAPGPTLVSSDSTVIISSTSSIVSSCLMSLNLSQLATSSGLK